MQCKLNISKNCRWSIYYHHNALKNITLKHIKKEIKRGICVPVDGGTVNACKLRVIDSAVGKRFVVVLDGGGVIIRSEAEE